MGVKIFQMLLIEGFLGGFPSHKIVYGSYWSMPHHSSGEAFVLLCSCRLENRVPKVIIS